MTGFHPDAVIRDGTLSDNSATRQYVAAGRTGTGVSRSRALRQRAWPDSRSDLTPTEQAASENRSVDSSEAQRNNSIGFIIFRSVMLYFPHRNLGKQSTSGKPGRSIERANKFGLL